MQVLMLLSVSSVVMAIDDQDDDNVRVMTIKTVKVVQ